MRENNRRKRPNFITNVHAGVPNYETHGGVAQWRFPGHSGAKEKGGLWFGRSTGRKAIHVETEKQMLGG